MFSDPWGFFILNPFTNVLLLIYNLIGHNFGLAVILFTILIRAITWPLNAQQLKGARVMQDLQNDKEWQDIQKKYAKDREKLAQEQMRIYKDRGINPFASPAHADPVPDHHRFISKRDARFGGHAAHPVAIGTHHLSFYERCCDHTAQ